jgi:hypothetical protein
MRKGMNKGITHVEGHINIMETDLYTNIMKVTIDSTTIKLVKKAFIKAMTKRMVIINIIIVIIMMDFIVNMRNMQDLNI